MEYKMHIICDTIDKKHGRSVAGEPFTEGWWKAFSYWLETKLANEGLLVTGLFVEERKEVLPN